MWTTHTHCFCQKYKHTLAGHHTPQPATPQLPNPNSFNTPQHGAHSSSIPSPIQQPRQQSPLQTNINPSAQSFIPAAATHTTVCSTPEQRIPKSLNVERVKTNRQQGISNAQDEQLCFHCKQPGHLKKDCPEPPYCSSVEQKDTYLQSALQRTRTVGQWTKDENFEETREMKTAKLTEKNGSVHRTNHNCQTETTNA